MLKVMRPFSIVSVHPNALSNDGHGIYSVVSIDRATLVPETSHLLMLLSAYQFRKTLRRTLAQIDKILKPHPMNMPLIELTPTKDQKMTFAIEFADSVINQNIHTLKPAEHLPQNFIYRY